MVPELQRDKVTLKMEISHCLHSQIIGRGGRNTQKVNWPQIPKNPMPKLLVIVYTDNARHRLPHPLPGLQQMFGKSRGNATAGQE
jgi:hypothetical protein